MASIQPGTDREQNDEDHSLDSGLTNLSLSSQSIHADDFLNSGQDVAPPLHVSTTYRYNSNPETLKPWAERDVSTQYLALTI